jgi:hypothetical protein
MKLRRIALLLPLVLAACGGGGAATQPAATSAAAQPTGPSEVPSETTAAGGGTAGNWCLNTQPEVEAALRVSGVVGTSTDAQGVGGGCFYALADGTAVHAISVVKSAGFEGTFQAGKQTQGAVEVGGIGKGAVLMSDKGPLVVLTDRGLISMGPLGPADIMSDPAKYRAAAEALAKSAVGRMP